MGCGVMLFQVPNDTSVPWSVAARRAVAGPRSASRSSPRASMTKLPMPVWP
jgi:hypothetical protein